MMSIIDSRNHVHNILFSLVIHISQSVSPSRISLKAIYLLELPFGTHKYKINVINWKLIMRHAEFLWLSFFIFSENGVKTMVVRTFVLAFLLNCVIRRRSYDFVFTICNYIIKNVEVGKGP